jgi:LAO/AO transport system kinase
MEIADIFVVNKADNPKVEQTIAEIQSLVDITCFDKERKIPIVETIAKQGKGINEMISEIEKHRKYLTETKTFEKQRRLRYEAELVEIIKKQLMSLIFDEETLKKKIDTLLNKIYSKEIDPYTASEEILGKILK